MSHKVTLNQLKEIKLFSNLDDDILEKFTDMARLSSYKKEDNIFFLEEKITKFYIINTGFVRTYCLDDKGNDSTLQILSPYNFINDILGDSSPIAAQAIQDCSIIEFNADKIKNYFETNPTLAMNFANEVMLINKNLLSQLSQSRLLSAKEKLGRFLLGLSFVKNDEKSLEIDLQYSKSIIASYLGINLETFSRALKKLKDDKDISIMGNKITFLTKNSLCDYCDDEIGSKCNNRGEIYCKYD